MYWPLLLRKPNAGAVKTSFFNDATAAISFSSRGSKWLGGPFLRFLLRGGAIRAKLGTNHLNTLHKHINNRSFLCVVGCSSFAAALLVCCARSRRTGRIMWVKAVNGLGEELAPVQPEVDHDPIKQSKYPPDLFYVVLAKLWKDEDVLQVNQPEWPAHRVMYRIYCSLKSWYDVSSSNITMVRLYWSWCDVKTILSQSRSFISLFYYNDLALYVCNSFASPKLPILSFMRWSGYDSRMVTAFN